MEDNFRRHCESALIHPATVAALVVLLVNDVVLKSMWPDAWGTGKLSDLAWVVFASPLLAFLLSFVVGRRTAWQRAAFLTSYAGLPLLYAAFNTFEPVHGWILRGISFLSGGTAGSPLDATDSLVIPLGLGIALWVWRSGAASRPALRLRWGLLMAAVAALASVASTETSPDLGITRVGVSDGTVYAQSEHRYPADGSTVFWSRDSGLTWTRGPANEDGVQWGGMSAETPRGTYSLQGPDIVLSAPEGLVVAYSAAHVQEESNVWVQGHATKHLDDREITTAPFAMAYDGRSGNLIVAMGIQGVVMGTADGQWERYAVGRYLPTEFTFSGKTGLLLSSGEFWVAALALSLSMAALALLASQYRPRDLPLVAAVAALALSVLVTPPIALVVTGNEDILDSVLLGAFAFILVLYGAIGLGVVLGFMSRESFVRKGLGLALGLVSLLASGALVLAFGQPDADDLSLTLLFVVLAVPAFVFGVATLSASWEQLWHWRALIAALAGMNALTVLAFMLWLHVGITLTLAKVSAIVLAALVGLVLAAYIKSRPRPGDPTPVSKGGPTPRC